MEDEIVKYNNIKNYLKQNKQQLKEYELNLKD